MHGSGLRAYKRGNCFCDWLSAPDHTNSITLYYFQRACDLHGHWSMKNAFPLNLMPYNTQTTVDSESQFMLAEGLPNQASMKLTLVSQTPGVSLRKPTCLKPNPLIQRQALNSPFLGSRRSRYHNPHWKHGYRGNLFMLDTILESAAWQRGFRLLPQYMPSNVS